MVTTDNTEEGKGMIQITFFINISLGFENMKIGDKDLHTPGPTCSKPD